MEGKVVKIKVSGKINGKFYQGTCEAVQESRTDFAPDCRHRVVFRVKIESMPPALRKASLAKCKRMNVPVDHFCVCRCHCKVVSGGTK